MIKEDLTTPQPENADTRYSETTTRIPSTSLYETTSIVSIDSEKIESKGIYTLSVLIKLLYVRYIFLRNMRKEPIH